jgi:hypothetical protein
VHECVRGVRGCGSSYPSRQCLSHNHANRVLTCYSSFFIYYITVGPLHCIMMSSGREGFQHKATCSNRLKLKQRRPMTCNFERGPIVKRTAKRLTLACHYSLPYSLSCQSSSFSSRSNAPWPIPTPSLARRIRSQELPRHPAPAHVQSDGAGSP